MNLYNMDVDQAALSDNPDSPSYKNSLQSLLSRILAEFSSFISLLNKISFSQNKSDPDLVEEALSLFENKLVSSFLRSSNWNDEVIDVFKGLPSSAIIFKRFRCRLVEAILPCRERIQQSPANATNLLFTANQLEKEIYRFQDGLPFQDFLNNVFAVFFNYLTTEKESKSSARVSPLKRGEEKEKDKIESLLKPIHKSKSYYEESEYQKKMKKILLGVNQRFKTLDCLDLDYQHFRSSFFQSKNNYNELYDDCIQRNNTISCLILQYSKDFKDYLKNKEKRKAMKRLNMLNLQRSSIEEKNDRMRTKFNFLETSTIDREKRRSLKPFRVKASEFQISPKTKRSFMIGKFEELNEEKAPRKTQLQMKSILITPSKFKFELDDSPVRVNKPMKNFAEGLRKKSKKDQRVYITNLPDLHYRHKF